MLRKSVLQLLKTDLIFRTRKTRNYTDEGHHFVREIPCLSSSNPGFSGQLFNCIPKLYYPPQIRVPLADG